MTERLDVRIQGDSMWPTFVDGQVLSFLEVDSQTLLGQGDVVLAYHPLKDNVMVVKRILRVESDGRFFLVGDQTDPTATEDSHNFGPVARQNILAKWEA